MHILRQADRAIGIFNRPSHAEGEGGSDRLGNLHLICKKCNIVKGGLDDDEMKQLMAFLKTNMIIYQNLYKRLRMSGMVFTLMRRKK